MITNKLAKEIQDRYSSGQRVASIARDLSISYSSAHRYRLPPQTKEFIPVEPDYEILPLSVREELRSWINSGHTPNAFLRACLRNDLIEGSRRAPIEGGSTLLFIVASWLAHYAPQGSYGSARVFSDWPMFLRAQARLINAEQNKA